MDDAQRGLDILGFAREETGKVKGNLEGIDRLCADAQNTIRNYARIKKVLCFLLSFFLFLLFFL